RVWRPLWSRALVIPSVSIGTGFLGLDRPHPEQNSSGGKDRLGNISKQGNRYLRSLFTAGALAVIRWAKPPWSGTSAMARGIAGAAADQVAAIAVADKIARMAWAMMTKGERRRNPYSRHERYRAGASGVMWTVGRSEQHVVQSRPIR